MRFGLDIADVPTLLLRRRSPFSSMEFLPEWSFWYYVAEREDAEEALAAAESCARFFLENYPGFDKRPPILISMVRKYRAEWWASIHRHAPSESPIGDAFHLIDELEATCVGIDSRISVKRPRKRKLVLSIAAEGGKPARLEIDVGYLGNPLNFRIYHPVTGRKYQPEWFFGFFGTGQIRIWEASDLYEKLVRIRDFCEAFLPVVASCTKGKPPTPYDQVQSP